MFEVLCHRSPFKSVDEITSETLSSIDFNLLLSFADGTEAPSKISTRAALFYNDDFLFILFFGRYEQLRLSESSKEEWKTMQLWEQSDVYEVFVGVNAAIEKKYKEFQLSPDGRYFDSDVDLANGTSNHQWESGLQGISMVFPTPQKWYSVFGIPWKCFSQDYKNDIIHINLYRASGKFHGDELLALCPTGYGSKCFHRPEKFGKLVIVE